MYMDTVRQMLVSIIIPVYKVEDYIEACLLSVLGQTYKNMEIILVDDCGGDSSIEVAQRLLRKSECLWKVVQHDSNRGLSAARNSGVCAATGDFIFFLDSDDVLQHEAIGHLVSLQREHQAEVVVGNVIRVDADGNEIKSSSRLIQQSKLSATPLDDLVKGIMPTVAWAKLFDRQFYIDNNLYFEEGIVHEDEPWGVLLALKCTSIYYSDKVIYHYRTTEGSIMNKLLNNPLLVKSCVRVIELTCEYLSKNHIELKGQRMEWFQRKIFVLLMRIFSCRKASLVEKMKTYRYIFSQYFDLKLCHSGDGYVMPLARTLCSVLPPSLSFIIAAYVGSYLPAFKRRIQALSGYLGGREVRCG